MAQRLIKSVVLGSAAVIEFDIQKQRHLVVFRVVG